MEGLQPSLSLYFKPKALIIGLVATASLRDYPIPLPKA
jgi:hypothetical protein